MPNLWTREGVDGARSAADVSLDAGLVVVAQGTSPADGLQAAREPLGEDAVFSHIKHGYPVYRTE
jgi:hypothetical protein